MSFLNPLALFALAAAAIPLIVHLFNFRRPRRVEFSSLVFLRELERSAMQRVRIQQWLLLVLRTLAIACLVLAFARPTLTGGSGGAVAPAGGPVAIVIDDSPSMAVLERAGERLRLAKDATLRIIDQAQDDVYLITTSDGPLSEQPLGRAAATEAVAGLQIRPYSRPLHDAVDEAGALIRESPMGGEIFVVSDFQRTSLIEPSSDDRVEAPISIVPVGERMPGNIGVVDVEITSRIIDVGQPLHLEATIRNYAPVRQEEIVVGAYVGDERVAQAVISIDSESSERVPIIITPRERGWSGGRVVVEDEAFSADNERHFAYFVPESRRLLIVREPGTAENLLLALSPDVAGGRVVFERDVVSASALSGQSLGRFDAVVLAGIPSVSSGQIGLIADYVEDGGGVLIYPGARADAESYNRLLARLGAGQLGAMAGSTSMRNPIASIGQADVDHPLFEGVFESGGRVEDADVFAAFRYTPGGGTEQTVITMSNGWPLLQEIRTGAGTTFLFSSALDPSWNELAVRGLFVPLVYRSMFYLSASDVEASRGMLLSESTTVRLPEDGADATISVVTPAGEELAQEQRSMLGTRRVSVDGRSMQQPGLARLVDADQGTLRHVLPVNIDPAEGDPAIYSPSEAAEMLETATTAGVRILNASEGMDALSQALSDVRRGHEIWNVLLLLALGFLVAEMLIARRWRPETAPA